MLYLKNMSPLVEKRPHFAFSLPLTASPRATSPSNVGRNF